MLLKKKIAPEKASKQKSILFYYCWWWDESTGQVWKLSSATKKGRAFRRSGQGINTPNSIQGVPTPNPYSRPWIPIFIPLDLQGWSKALCSFQVCHLSGMRRCSWREKILQCWAHLSGFLYLSCLGPQHFNNGWSPPPFQSSNVFKQNIFFSISSYSQREYLFCS